MMRAPKPTLILASTRDFFDIDGTWDSFRQAKRFFTRFGFADRVNIVRFLQVTERTHDDAIGHDHQRVAAERVRVGNDLLELGRIPAELLRCRQRVRGLPGPRAS